MGGKSKAPKAPDYSGLAKSDAEQQRITANELTRANRPTQIDAQGNRMDWSQDAAGNWTQKETLNPEAAAGNAAMQTELYKRMAAAGAQPGFKPPDTLKYSDATGGYLYDAMNQAGPIANFDANTGKAVADAMYESSMSRLRPENERTQSSIDNKLRQQGLQPGTEAYDRAMKNLMTSQGDVTSKLALDSTGAGYQSAMDMYRTALEGQGQRFSQEASINEQNRARQGQRYDQSAGNAGRRMQEQGQRFNQALTTSQAPMNEAMGYQQLFAGRPGSQFQGFSGATGYNPASMTNAAQNTYNAKMGAANASAGKNNNLLQTGATLGGAAIMASDMALKENIQPLDGKASLAVLLKLGGYEYSWKDTGEEAMGVLAQEVEKVLPDLVVRAKEGHLMVDYAGIVAIAVQAIRYLAGDKV